MGDLPTMSDNIRIDTPPALTIEILVERVVAAQREAGDAIDPNGARKLIRALVALGLLKVA